MVIEFMDGCIWVVYPVLYDSLAIRLSIKFNFPGDWDFLEVTTPLDPVPLYLKVRSYSGTTCRPLRTLMLQDP
jgi:hypothetical protein